MVIHCPCQSNTPFLVKSQKYFPFPGGWFSHWKRNECNLIGSAVLTKFPDEEAKTQYLNSQIYLYAKLISFLFEENDEICHWPSGQSNKLYIYPCMLDAIYAGYISLHTRQYARYIFPCIYTAIYALHISLHEGGNMPEQRIYVWDYCHFFFSCIFRPQQFAQFGILLHYCNMPENILCNEIIGTLSTTSFAQMFVQLCSLLLLLSGHLCTFEITSSLSWRQMSTYFLKYKNLPQLSGRRRK